MDDLGGFVSVRSHMHNVLNRIKWVFGSLILLYLCALAGSVSFFFVMELNDHAFLYMSMMSLVTANSLLGVVASAVTLHAARKKNPTLMRSSAKVLGSSYLFVVVSFAFGIMFVSLGGSGLALITMVLYFVPTIILSIGLTFVVYYFLLVEDRTSADENEALAASTGECEKLLQSAREEKWFIEFRDVELLLRIGSGAFGEVWKAKWKKQEVAVKKMHEVVSPMALQDFMREAALLSKFRHPNVIQFFGAASSGDNLFLVTEFAANGSLFDVIHDRKEPLPLERRLRMALDTARGVGYLHSLTPIVIHRDLKSPNLLVMDDWTVKVSDFGTSKWIEKTATMTANIGSPMWSAPEVLTQSQYSEKADIFSFAIILWELLTLKTLYPGKLGFQLAIEVGTEGLRPELPTDLPDSVTPLVDLMQRAWAEEPHDRPPMSAIVEEIEAVVQAGDVAQ